MSAGDVNELSCLGVLFSLSFHRSSQPGFGMSLEIFASVRIQEDLCASLALVTQSPVPRWPDATVVASRAQTAAVWSGLLAGNVGCRADVSCSGLKTCPLESGHCRLKSRSMTLTLELFTIRSLPCPAQNARQLFIV